MQPAKPRSLRFLLHWLDSNELAWMPPRWWHGTPAERDVWHLRILARRRIRRELIARQGLARTLTQAAVWPGWALLKTVLHLRQRPLRKPGLGAWVLRCLDIYWLQLAYNIGISDQFDCRLELPEFRRLVRLTAVCREQQSLNSSTHLIAQGYRNIVGKQVFAEFCSEHGLPTVPVICAGRGDQLLSGAVAWPARDVFFKPANMAKGLGMEVFSYDATTGQWRTAAGIIVTPQSLAAYARRQLGMDAEWLLQPRIFNASAWPAYGSGALSTCRVMTGRVGPNETDIVILGAYVRCSLGNLIVDNLSAGGIGIGIDLTHERLTFGLEWVNYDPPLSHIPSTGAVITGTPVPALSEIVNLALRAHRAAGNWSSVGWDLALLDEGPVLIEANLQWAINPFLPVGMSRLPEVLRTCFGPHYERFPS